MANINGIGLENFRVFKEKQWFDFAPITILTGTNSSGKSSLVNAMKLLSKNEMNLKAAEPDVFDLNEIINHEFDTAYILERYGSLQSFVSHDSVNSEFSFSLKEKHNQLHDEFEIIFTVRIQDNKMKTGKVQSIKIISVNKNVVVFSVNKEKTGNKIDSVTKLRDEKIFNESNYYCNINLLYFLEHFLNLISNFLENESGDEIAKIYEEDTEPDVFLAMFNDYSDRSFTLFDFKFLWGKNEVNEIIFKSIIKNYYDEYNGEVLKSLQIDILNFLSNWEWRLDELNFISRRSPAFAGFYEGNVPFNFSFSNFCHDQLIKMKEDVLNIESQNLTLNAPGIDLPFVEKVFIPLIKMTYKELENSDAEIETSESEIFFYNKFIFQTFSLLKDCLKNFKDIKYIDASRIETKRSFSVNAKDNFSNQVKLLFKESKRDYNKSVDFINKWLSAFEIAKEISFEEEKDTEFFKVYLINKTDKRILLADYGYGISQLLPIILYLIPEINYNISDLQRSEEIINMSFGKEPVDYYLPKTIVIEEPENSLHPALQSKLADMFAEAAKKFNIQLIIETHSEYLIRKLQSLTAESQIKPEDTQLYYFYPPDKVPEGEQQVYPINIQEDGALTKNFGRGFFDEASNLNIALYSFSKANKN